MKWLSAFQNNLRAAFHKIHLVDKCLIIIMSILLCQSAFNLFAPGGTAVEMDTIDVVVRTATASIFGYFISANFIRHSAAPGTGTGTNAGQAKPEVSAPTPQESAIQNRIGFAGADSNSETGLEPGGASSSDNKNNGMTYASRLQIIVAAGIGVFCLLTLLLLRDISLVNASLQNSHSVTATVAQFRDFVSGCVGFLIGCPTGSDQPKD